MSLDCQATAKSIVHVSDLLRTMYYCGTVTVDILIGLSDKIYISVYFIFSSPPRRLEVSNITSYLNKLLERLSSILYQGIHLHDLFGTLVFTP